MPMSNACSLIVVSYKNLLKPAPAAGKAWQSFYFFRREESNNSQGGETGRKHWMTTNCMQAPCEWVTAVFINSHIHPSRVFFSHFGVVHCLLWNRAQLLSAPITVKHNRFTTFLCQTWVNLGNEKIIGY